MTTLVRRYKPNLPTLPFDDFEKEFFSPFESLIQDFFNDTNLVKSFASSSKGSYPKVDIIEKEKEFNIIAEIPGLKKEDVKIKITTNEGKSYLSLSSDKREKVEESDDGKIIYKELKRSSFSRSWELSDNIDSKKVDAKFENGELLITLPKISPTKLGPEESYVEIK